MNATTTTATTATSNKTIVQNLISEYPLAGKSSLQVLPSFPHVFVDKLLAPLAPYYRSNPLQQSYVFYGDSNNSSNSNSGSSMTIGHSNDPPVVNVDEFAWEPRLSMKVSLLYLESSLNALLTSHKAWVGRRHAEAMRLGLFESPEAAFQCGWQQISIRIPCAKLAVSRQRGRAGSVTSSMATAMSAPNKYSYLLPAPSPGDEGLLSFPSDVSAAAIEVAHAQRAHSAAGSGLTDRMRTAYATSSNLGRRVDESLPCTYVDIYIEDR